MVKAAIIEAPQYLNITGMIEQVDQPKKVATLSIVSNKMQMQEINRKNFFRITRLHQVPATVPNYDFGTTFPTTPIIHGLVVIVGEHSVEPVDLKTIYVLRHVVRNSSVRRLGKQHCPCTEDESGIVNGSCKATKPMTAGSADSNASSSLSVEYRDIAMEY